MGCVRVLAICLLAAASLLRALPASADPQPISSGSGFLVNDVGWIVTNAHVVEGCTSVAVAGLGSARDIKRDDTNDLAAFRIPAAVSKPFLRFRDAPPRLGEDIAAFGFPLSGMLSDSIKVTTGNINALSGLHNDARYLQISTPIQHGNSGGPIVDKQGRVLGVVAGLLGPAISAEEGLDIRQNVNFAVNADVLKAFLRSHDITHEAAPNSQEPEPSTADLSDHVAPSVMQVLCYGEDGRPESGADVQPGTDDFQVAGGFDAIGYDYRAVSNISAAACKQLCETELGCRAATYNKPARYCFLKDNARLLIHNSDAVAFLAPEVANTVKVSTFTISSGFDSPGNDYARIRKSEFVGCYLQCEMDQRCQAFAYVRKTHDCWLKDSLSRFVAKKGVDLGVR